MVQARENKRFTIKLQTVSALLVWATALVILGMIKPMQFLYSLNNPEKRVMLLKVSAHTHWFLM